MEKEERKPENGERKLIGGYLLNRGNVRGGRVNRYLSIVWPI